MKAHRFDGMEKSVRSAAIELAENLPAVEQWRLADSISADSSRYPSQT
jgi:hypothetical protein